MKKIFLVFVLCTGVLTTMAQDSIMCYYYPRYLYYPGALEHSTSSLSKCTAWWHDYCYWSPHHDPISHGGNPYILPCPVGTIYTEGFVADTPISVHGIAVPLVDVATDFLPPGPHPISSCLLETEDVIPLWMMLFRKEHGHYVRVDSVLWHRRDHPDHMMHFPCPYEGWLPHNNGCFHYDPPYETYEFYFDHPYVMEDTFFVGMRLGGEPSLQFDVPLLRPIIAHSYETTLDCTRLVLVSDSNCCLHERELCPTNGCFYPIILPLPDTDVVQPCLAPTGLRLTGREMGYPSFAWDTTGYGQEVFQLQYAPYDQDNWRTVTPTENPFRIYTNFDRSTYYKARIRARCHHGCPIHDTTMWSPWSDTILFHTGVTPPDTSTHDTTAINPVGDAQPGLFALTPNPTTGSVTLQVNSEKLKDKSCTVTVLDAAGHEVLRTTLNSQPSTLNLQSLPSGTYFVTLQTQTVTATQKLILKNK